MKKINELTMGETFTITIEDICSDYDIRDILGDYVDEVTIDVVALGEKKLVYRINASCITGDWKIGGIENAKEELKNHMEGIIKQYETADEMAALYEELLNN